MFFQRHKRSKLGYYIRAVVNTFLMPRSSCRRQLKTRLLSVSAFDRHIIKQRVNHYNRLAGRHELSDGAVRIADVDRLARPRVYSFDSQEHLRYFPASLKINYRWGDVTHVPGEPAFVKSRPVQGDNANAVILKLDKVRHFNFINDKKPFLHKQDKLIGRGVITQPHRIRFYEQYFGHPLCDLGQINTDGNPHWLTEKLSIDAHLDYKFILALEGNDVATNLKWVMSSNSLAVMPIPKFETWFMESTLIPDFHYVCIKDDYSDLEEKLKHYIQHPNEALKIIANAHRFVAQFRNQQLENLISLLVIEKYFYRTGQLEPINASLYEPDQ